MSGANMTYRRVWLALLLTLLGLAGARAENPEIVWEAYRGSQFHFPTGVSVDQANGACWVADTLNSEVALLSPDGLELWRRGGFDRPYAVAADPVTGEGWVADTFANRVVRLNGVLDAVWSKSGFHNPYRLEMDQVTRSVWVLETDRITHLDKAGNEVGRYSHSGYYPISLAADSTDDSAWATFCYNCPPIGPCAPDAPYTVHLSSAGAEVLKLDRWYGVAFSVNTAEHRVWASLSTEEASGLLKMTRDGEVTDVFPSFYGESLQAHSTLGDGSCWVTEGGAVVLVGRYGEELWRSDRFWLPYTISAKCDDDSCWVADTENCQVVKLQLRPRLFPDVPPRLWAWHEIGACAQAGIVLGFSSDGCYHYERPVTRDQMAVYTARALAGGDENVPSGPAVASFSDVPKDSWAYKYVEYAAQRGVVQGYKDGTYDPGKELDRGQMAVFIARSICDPTGEEGLAGFPLPPLPTFADIPSDFWAYRHIEYLSASDRQVVRGYPDGLYHPEFICRRDQMAVYIARAFALPPWPPEGASAVEGGE